MGRRAKKAPVRFISGQVRLIAFELSLPFFAAVCVIAVALTVFLFCRDINCSCPIITVLLI
jgi:hypothetical protein